MTAFLCVSCQETMLPLYIHFFCACPSFLSEIFCWFMYKLRVSILTMYILNQLRNKCFMIIKARSITIPERCKFEHSVLAGWIQACVEKKILSKDTKTVGARNPVCLTAVQSSNHSVMAPTLFVCLVFTPLSTKFPSYRGGRYLTRFQSFSPVHATPC